MSVDVGPGDELFVTVRGHREFLRSDDGGQSFQVVGDILLTPSDMTNLEFPGALIDPLDAEHFVGWRRWGASDALIESFDGGVSWLHVSLMPGLIRDMAVAPSGAYYLGFHSYTLHRSETGTIWPAKLDLTPPNSIHHAAISASSDSIWKTTDGGIFWAQADEGLPSPVIEAREFEFESDGSALLA